MTELETRGRINRAAALLLQARRARAPIDRLPHDAWPHTADEAYAIQAATVAQLGGVAGWKVGAPSPAAEPSCAPLASSLVFESPARIDARQFNFIGVEVELAFRFAHDLPTRATPYTREEVLDAVGSVHPAIEIVDSRYKDWRARGGLETLSDCANNGAFVLGSASRAPATIDQMTQPAELWIDNQRVVSTRGSNSAGDVRRLLTWLANHLAKRGTPLQTHAVATTGSCTGLVMVGAGAEVRGVLPGVGEVSLVVSR